MEDLEHKSIPRLENKLGIRLPKLSLHYKLELPKVEDFTSGSDLSFLSKVFGNSCEVPISIKPLSKCMLLQVEMMVHGDLSLELGCELLFVIIDEQAVPKVLLHLVLSLLLYNFELATVASFLFDIPL